MADKTDLSQLAEAELHRLQKQLRSIQLELHVLLEEKLYQMKKENNIISVLQKEYDTLKDEISFYAGGGRKKDNLHHRDQHFSNLQNKLIVNQKTLITERINLWELDGHLRKICSEIELVRKNETPDNGYKDKICKIQKTAMKLENRLDVVNKKCSDILSENRALRRYINHMLRDRTNFNDMWMSKVTQFNEGQKYIMDLIDQSTLAFDLREELCNKVQILKDRSENDKVIHVQEMREMQRRLDHDAKLHRFFDIKGQKRLNPELEQREANKKLARKANFEKKLEHYKSISNKLRLLCRDSESADLKKQFKNQEEGTFALFNYVNELSYENEVLSNSTLELSNEIKRQKAVHAKNLLKVKTEAIEFLESELQRLKYLTEKSLTQCNSLKDNLQILIFGISDIFKQLNCGTAPILNVLNSKTTLTVQNVKLFVGVIERRVNLLMIKMNIEENNKMLTKKDKIPKFNVKDIAKIKN